MPDTPSPLHNPLHNPFKGMPKWGVYTAVGGGVAIAGFLVYRHHKSSGSWNPWSTGSSTASAVGGANAIDPITGLAYSNDNATDPITGQAYLAEAQEYGTVAAAEAAVTAFGQSTATGTGIGVNPASPASTGSVNTVVGTSVYTSNAAWAQAATAGLTDVGYDGPAVSTALGLFLTQSPVTPAQAQLINTAIAEYGPAPVGDLQVVQAPPAKPANLAPITSAPANIAVRYSSGNVNIEWSAVAGATKYSFAFSNGKGETVTGVTASYAASVVGQSGTFKIRAGSPSGWGPWSAEHKFNIPKTK